MLKKDTRNLFFQIKKLVFIDVGCSDSLDSKWYDLLPILEYIGFDPNLKECQRLSQESHPYQSAYYLPYALAGKKENRSMYKTNSIYCYSLLAPNHDWLRRFSFHDLFTQKGTEQINCTTLDYLAEEENLKADIIKLDTQGLELPILKASSKVLSNVFCVETETGFTENYCQETTFSQVDEFMRAQGYLLFDIKYYKQSRNNDFKNIGRHQPLWCEAVWLFDFIGQKKQPNFAMALKALRICKALRYYDYGLELCYYFKDCNIFNDEMLCFFKDPSNWKSKKHYPQTKMAKLLSLLPEKIQKRIMSEIHEVVDY